MLRLDASLQALLGNGAPDPQTAAVQHVLTGDSVVDWRRLRLRRPEEVDALLRQNRLDPRHPGDRRYLMRLHAEAVRFARDELGHGVGPDVEAPGDLRELFLMASGGEGRTRAEACMLLKVMNVAHHLNARELRLRLPASDGDLSFAADSIIYDALTRLQAAGVPVVRFEGGLKSRSSLLLKLMTPGYRAAHDVPDRVRYRVVVESRRDLVRALRALLEEALPFNVVVPGQTRNDLLPLEAAVTPEHHNRHSGPGFRVLSFVADLPIRCADYFEVGPELLAAWGPVVFATLEMQLVDRHTAEQNEAGENAHTHYKARQRQGVLSRLAPELVGEQAPGPTGAKRSG